MLLIQCLKTQGLYTAHSAFVYQNAATAIDTLYRGTYFINKSDKDSPIVPNKTWEWEQNPAAIVEIIGV